MVHNIILSFHLSSAAKNNFFFFQESESKQKLFLICLKTYFYVISFVEITSQPNSFTLFLANFRRKKKLVFFPFSVVSAGPTGIN